MRIVTYGAACSLDGFITAADGSIDWLHFSKDVQQIMKEYWATIDTVLMGRKTWDFAASMGSGSGAAENASSKKSAAPDSPGAKAPPKRQRPTSPTTYVFSRTLT